MKNPMQNSAQGTTRDELAKIAGVSHDTIAKIEKIETNASEETNTKRGLLSKWIKVQML